MININAQLTPSRSGPAVGTWRTPLLIIGFGCLISLMSFGPRSALGFFLTPMSAANHWGRDVFAFALALQNLLWGIGQPLAGIIADRFGTGRVLCVGGLMYAAGLALMSQAASAPVVDFSAGVLIGFGLSGTSFMVVLAAFGKLLPQEWRSRAFGFGTAAGSFGQFLYAPVAVAFVDTFGWQPRACLPCAALADAGDSDGGRDQRGRAANSAARTRRGIRSPLLLAAGAWFLHLRVPACVHHGAYAGLFGRPRPICDSWRLDNRGDWFVQHRRIDHCRLARRPDAETPPPLDNLFRPCGSCPWVHFVSCHSVLLYRIRRDHGPNVAVNRAADQRHHRRYVRHAVADNVRRLRLLQPSGRRLPWRLAWRHRVRPHGLLRPSVVAGDPVRRPVGADQPADRRETSFARRRGTGVINANDAQAGHDAWVAAEFFATFNAPIC
jgi:hypothetical protein